MVRMAFLIMMLIQVQQRDVTQVAIWQHEQKQMLMLRRQSQRNFAISMQLQQQLLLVKLMGGGVVLSIQ